jgi:hypothetical protein
MWLLNFFYINTGAKKSFILQHPTSQAWLGSFLAIYIKNIIKFVSKLVVCSFKKVKACVVKKLFSLPGNKLQSLDENFVKFL